MPRNFALVTPQLLAWARERISMPIDIAAASAGVTVDKYRSWESGEQLPTVNQAKKFAKKARIPYAWLFLATPPDKYRLPKNTDYRTFANKGVSGDSLELQCLIADVAMRRDAMIELYTEMGMLIPRFDSYMNAETSDNASIAQTIRNLLSITLERQSNFKNPNEAFNYYIEALSDLGILVFQAGNLEKSTMRGMSIYDPVFPIIVVNRKDECNARIFTLLHEFVHILTKTPGICDDFGAAAQSRFKIEAKCNRIAAEALVPQNELLSSSDWLQIKKHGWSDESIRRISRNFSVSREVIIGRLLALGEISPDFYHEKLSLYAAEYKQKTGSDGFLPPAKDVCSQVGKLYARTVMSAYNQEIITPRDASHFLSRLRIQHFSKVESWCFS